MTSVIVAIVVGLAIGLLVGWAVGHAQPRDPKASSTQGVLGSIAGIAALF